MEIVKVDLSNLFLINDFLKNAGDSLSGFRYFNTRSLDVINNHLITYVISVDSNIIGYGHLDKDGETIWLGIAVAEAYKGKGYGRVMMNHLIDFAKAKSITSIDLSVDADNIKAQHLYQSFGFVCYDVKNNTYYYKLFL